MKNLVKFLFQPFYRKYRDLRALVNPCVKKDQAATPILSGSSGNPLTKFIPRYTSWGNSGAFSRRNLFSATGSILKITAVAFSTFLNRLAASVRSRSAAKGDSTTLVVRRWIQ